MSLTNCKRCGALFSATNGTICPKCLRKEEELLENANQWLRDNPEKTINEMSVATGIDKRQILRWARQKRIMLTEKSAAVVCKRCGDPISGGTLCDRCKLLMAHDVDRGLKAIKENDSSFGQEKEKKGMYYHREDRESKTRLL